MLVTAIRRNGQKLEQHEIESIAEKIRLNMERIGFKTDSEVKNSTSIKVGLHMSSFRIDTAMLGHNGRMGYVVKSPKGYKRTDVPTWDQRVKFNDTLNDLLDSWDIVCNIKSGPYTVRNKARGAFTESDWDDQTPSWQGQMGDLYNGMGQLMSAIRTESECRETMDSDRLEQEHKANTRDDRLSKARLSRAKRKAFEQSSHVTLAGLNGIYSKGKYSPNPRNGKKVTHYVFAKMLSKMSSWEQRRVKQASMDATCKPKLELIQGGAA